jgi:sphingosine kinase
LKDIKEPVPSNWTIIDDKFTFFLLVTLPLVEADSMIAPEATADDGDLHIIFAREGLTRFELLKVLLSMVNGEYLESNLVEYVKVKAFRLEPIDNQGIIMIDGERIPTGVIQGEIAPKIARILLP